MTSLFRRPIVAAGLIAAGSLLYAAPAAAQATRTWVSGVGDDVNPCSRTAPCKTFAGAISKTAAGGEINCIDQGAYGAVTITKSIALVCVGVTAGVLHSATNGIVINAAATDVIFIKGLDINGGTPSAAGLNGIRFLAGASLTVQDSIIRNSIGATPNGNGILFAPSTPAELLVEDTTIDNTGNAGSGSGIELAPTAGGSVRATVRNSRITNSAGNGIRLNTTAGAVNAVIDTVVIANGSQGVIILAPTNGGNALITGSNIENNTGAGILAAGAAARARVGTTTITANTTGVSAVSSANINSFGTNLLIGNGTDGTFNPPVIPSL